MRRFERVETNRKLTMRMHNITVKTNSNRKRENYKELKTKRCSIKLEMPKDGSKLQTKAHKDGRAA